VVEELTRGNVLIADLEPIMGREIGKRRPVVVIQNDVGNRFSPTTIVAAVTEYSAKKSRYPFCTVIEAGEGGLSKRSVVNCSQIRTIDRKRLVTSLGKLREATMVLVDQALRNSLSL
jgi:mRNA interferase MazF